MISLIFLPYVEMTRSHYHRPQRSGSDSDDNVTDRERCVYIEFQVTTKAVEFKDKLHFPPISTPNISKLRSQQRNLVEL